MRDWRTYDDVAETYERVHAPRLAEVARDLVEMIDLPAGAAVLDVGTGTGVAAQAAADAGATVVGVDESLGMLRVARRERPKVPVAAALAIDLPFGSGRFDAVLGAFVLAHFDKIDTDKNGSISKAEMEAAHKGKEGKCGEGKCGGDAKKGKEGSCGSDKGKEGSCGGDKKGKEGSCGGEKKGKEGSCGGHQS